jgi:hypothetical protein
MPNQTWIFNSKTNQLYNSDTGARFVLNEGPTMLDPQQTGAVLTQECEVVFMGPGVALGTDKVITFTDVLYQGSRKECEKYLGYLAGMKHVVDIQRLITKTKLGV